jgi:hypothetical protein
MVPQLAARGGMPTGKRGSLIWTLHRPLGDALLERAKEIIPRELSKDERHQILKEW